MEEDFLEMLRDILRGFGWTEIQIESELPRMLRVMMGLGMVLFQDGEYVPTMRVFQERAWDAFWGLLAQDSTNPTPKGS